MFLPWLTISASTINIKTDEGIHLSVNLAPFRVSSDIKSDTNNIFVEMMMPYVKQYFDMAVKEKMSTFMMIFGIIPIILYIASIFVDKKAVVVGAGIAGITCASIFVVLFTVGLNSSDSGLALTGGKEVTPIDLITGVVNEKSSYLSKDIIKIQVGTGWYLTMIIGLALIAYPFIRKV